MGCGAAMASEPSLDITTRAATAGWSPHSGRQIRGSPCAKAFSIVPWPPCDTKAATLGNPHACGTHAVTTTFGGGLAMQPEGLPCLTFLPPHAEAEMRQGVLHRDKIGLELVTLQKKALQCNLPAESKTTIVHVAISPSHSR